MRVLLIAYVWPEPQSSAAGSRDFQLIDALRSAGHEVHVASAAQDSGLPACRPQLEARGIPAHAIALNDSNFDSWLRELAPDCVIFDRFVTEEQFGARVAVGAPDALRVLDTQDLHFLRRLRQENPSLTRQELAQAHHPDILRELASIYRSDWTLILSSYEYKILTEDFGIPTGLLGLCRFFLDIDAPRSVHLRSTGWEQRRDFVFLGNFRHAPNADAVRWLKREGWAQIRAALPAEHHDAQLHIYGAYPSREFMDMHSPRTGFRVHGPTEDALDCLARARVSLAPLRFGAGIKGKIAESFLVGTPVVTTPIGAEGMTDTGLWGGEIGELPEFARLAAITYSDPFEWNRDREMSLQILKQEYSVQKNGPAWTEQLAHRYEHRQEMRTHNRVGQLLWSEERRSTLYFSRWIELKEKAALAN